MMDSDTGYRIIRLLLQRWLGFICLMAFLVALNQFRPPCSDNGLLPAAPFMKFVPFREAPGIFYLFQGNRAYLTSSELTISAIDIGCLPPISDTRHQL